MLNDRDKQKGQVVKRVRPSKAPSCIDSSEDIYYISYSQKESNRLRGKPSNKQAGADTDIQVRYQISVYLKIHVFFRISLGADSPPSQTSGQLDHANAASSSSLSSSTSVSRSPLGCNASSAAHLNPVVEEEEEEEEKKSRDEEEDEEEDSLPECEQAEVGCNIGK